MLQKNVLVLIVNLFFWSFSFAQNNADSLLVFVGKKIDVNPIAQPISTKEIDTIVIGKDTTFEEKIILTFYAKHIARYRIVNMLNGKHDSDTVSFYAYHHQGGLGFDNFEYALLFLYPKKEGLVQEIYQYFDVYPTINDRWASSYAVSDYKHPLKNTFTVKPEKIAFRQQVSYKLLSKNTADIQEKFPGPFYKIDGDKAIAIYGNYVEDLFKLKQQGVLKLRGFYK